MLEGEAEDPRDANLVGSYQIYDIPPRPAGKTRLKVTYRYNHNQIVEVEAVDLNSNRVLPLREIRDNIDLNIVLNDRRVNVSLYTEFAGITRISGALSDHFGNALGNQYDLGRDGAFGNFHVHILYLNLVKSINFNLPQSALVEKGFKVSMTGNISETISYIKSNNIDVLWLISGSNDTSYSAPLLSRSQIKEIIKFYKLGKGIYLWTDNDPLFSHVNQILPYIAEAKVIGNTPGDKVLHEGDGIKLGTFHKHLITTGIVELYEGTSISYPDPLGDLLPLAVSTDGYPVICFKDRKNTEGRLLLDCGYTKLYCNWDSAGTARYVKNATVWLLGLDKQ